MALDRTGQVANGSAIAAGQTDAVVVPAASGRRVRVLGVFVFPTTTPPASLTFNSKGSGAGTAASPVLPLVASTPLIFQSHTGVPLFSTNVGEGLTVTNPTGTTAAVFTVIYVVS